MATAAAKELAVLLTGLAEPTRLRIFFRLAAGPLHVGGLAGLLGVPFLTVSQHLVLMRRAGLVEGERDPANGRRVVYSLPPGVFTPGTGGVLGTLAAGPYRVEFRADDAAWWAKKN